MKHLVWLLLIFSCIGAHAQGVYPHQFTELTSLTDSNWETYSQKSGLPRRISPTNLSAYFLKGVRAYVSGDVLYFSRRDSISSVSLAAYKQTLSVALNGSGQTQISISNGNTITLPAASVTGVTVEAPLDGAGTAGDPFGVADLGITTAKINDGAVTYAKMQQMTTARLLGRYSAGTGAVQEISFGTGLSLSVGGVLSAAGGGGDGNGIYSGSGALPNDTVKVTNTKDIKFKSPSNNNGTTVFSDRKRKFIADTYTDSLQNGLFLKQGVDSAALAIDKDGTLQLLGTRNIVVGNNQAKISFGEDDAGIGFFFPGTPNNAYRFPAGAVDQDQYTGSFNRIMMFDPSGGTGIGQFTHIDTLIAKRVRRDTFLVADVDDTYFPTDITNPARHYNNVNISAKSLADTTTVAFVGAPDPFAEYSGVKYRVKNDSGIVRVSINAPTKHLANTKGTYYLERGQTAVVEALYDQVQSGYAWAVKLEWDSLGDGNGIYSGDGVLSANRIVESAGKGILWNSIEYFALKSSNHTAQVGNGGFYQEKPLTLSGNKRYGIATQYDSRSTIANGAIVSPGPSFSTSLYHDLGAGTNYEWTDMHTLDTNNLVYGHMYGARYAPGMVMIRAIRTGTGSAYRLQPGLEIEVQPGNSSPWSPHSIFRSGADTLFQVKHSGALQAGKYGLGNMEASDLGKTRANYTPGFATDATIIDVANTNNSISSTTDASGDVTVTIPTMPNATYTALVAVTGTTLYGYTVHAKTTTSFKVRFYNTTTGAAVPVSTSITFDYDVKDY